MNKWMYLLTHIHIHPFFWMVVAIAIVTARFYELLILFIIVLIHELGHAVAASFFSWRIKQVLLLPFGGVLELEEHGNQPLKEELIVTIAGPIQHIWMMLLALFLYEMNMISPQDYLDFMNYNKMILLFNCLPILPLDGGKLLFLLFAKYFPFSIALKRAILLSGIFLIIYCISILIIMPQHLNGWIMVIFLFSSLYQEWKNRPYVVMRFLIERHSKEYFPGKRIKKLFVPIHSSINSVVEKLQKDRYHTIFVVENGKILGKIPEAALLTTYFEKQSFQLNMKDLLTKI